MKKPSAVYHEYDAQNMTGLFCMLNMFRYLPLTYKETLKLGRISILMQCTMKPLNDDITWG